MKLEVRHLTGVSDSFPVLVASLAAVSLGRRGGFSRFQRAAPEQSGLVRRGLAYSDL
jgi:hypothetical protein